ncbi:MAG TPA: Asp-tRNA(Asn)/Glu-tRNA(Gln) amidotransferase subunit GatB [Opitutaceae bacterium]|nr:Asp-tRNA(Asn)/Glu-tRNA(Gln) amidotransferase subunit GatB [Opitutaceae bacterium]
MNYEAVIGLEVHVQVRTRSKMFSSVGAGYGYAENTLTDPTVLGLPGALPVPNLAAIDAIIKSGLMLGCAIAPVSKFDRKNYFYPDSPKNYQISQFDQPFCTGGSVEIEMPGPSRNVMGEHKSIPLTRIHLEEDVGKLTHATVDSLVDLNRAGTPLMEIVSEPAMHTADEAFAFLTSLRMALVNGGISDCDMEKGQMRCDANVSIRPVGATALGTKVELKNLNSISFVRAGITHEIARQIAVVESGGTIVQETRGYDGETGMSVSQRSKEMAHDYRYFPDPDLMPVVVDEAWNSRLQAECPELPYDRQRRFMEQYALPYTVTSVFVPDRALCEFFEEAAKGVKKPLDAANWIANDLLKELSAVGVGIADSKVRPAKLAALVSLVDEGALSVGLAREVLSEMFKTGEEPGAIVERKGLRQSTDTVELETWARQAIAGNPAAVADFKAGKEVAINSLKGFVMKQSKGKANPRVVDEIMRRILAED